MNWPDFIVVVSSTLIPSLTTSVIAIVRAVKADNKAVQVAQDVNTIAEVSPHVNGEILHSKTIAPAEQQETIQQHPG